MGGPPNSSKLNDCSVEPHGDLGIPQSQKPPYHTKAIQESRKTHLLG